MPSTEPGTNPEDLHRLRPVSSGNPHIWLSAILNLRSIYYPDVENRVGKSQNEGEKKDIKGSSLPTNLSGIPSLQTSQLIANSSSIQPYATDTAMKLSAAIVSASLLGIASATIQGFDISNYQGSVDFASAYKSGARFVIIKVCMTQV